MGVSTHSTPKVLGIISAAIKGSDAIAEHENDIELEHDLYLTGAWYTTVTGSYDGSPEKSYLVSGLSDDKLTVLARKYKQNCWLKLENHKHGTYRASFVYVTRDNLTGAEAQAVGTGYFRSMDKPTIDRLGLDYTYRPDTGQFFTIWPTDTTIMKDFDEEVRVALAGKMGKFTGCATNHDILEHYNSGAK